MTELSVKTSRVISAPPDRVFNAWLDPNLLPRFMIPGPGTSVPSASNNPVEGGRFDIMMKAGDDEMPHSGVYLTIKPHSQIVFTWESPFSIDGSTVTVELAAVQGGTEVTLTHVKFPSEESRNNHNDGWNNILEALDTALAA